MSDHQQKRPTVFMDETAFHTDAHPFCADPLCPCYQEASEEEIKAYTDRQFNQQNFFYELGIKQQTTFFCP